LVLHRQHEYILPIKYNGGSMVSLSSSISYPLPVNGFVVR
jgi:hypothetical protein